MHRTNIASQNLPSHVNYYCQYWETPHTYSTTRLLNSKTDDKKEFEEEPYSRLSDWRLSNLFNHTTLGNTSVQRRARHWSVCAKISHVDFVMAMFVLADSEPWILVFLR
eukprot:g82008.t1